MEDQAISQIAIYRLTADHTGIHSSNERFFDAASYSRMKYGIRAEDMKRYAHELADQLWADVPGIFQESMPPAFVTSYKAVAPPFTTVARYTLDLINRKRFMAGLEPGKWSSYIVSKITLKNMQFCRLPNAGS